MISLKLFSLSNLPGDNLRRPNLSIIAEVIHISPQNHMPSDLADQLRQKLPPARQGRCLVLMFKFTFEETLHHQHFHGLIR